MRIWFGKQRRKSLSVFAVLALGSTCTLFSAESWTVDLNKLIHETQLRSPDPDRIGLVWWIPLEYWDVVLGQDATVTEEQLAEMREVLAPYLLIASVDGSIGPFGGVTFVEEAALRASIALVGQDGRSYHPLADDAISADALNLASMLGPVISNMLGPMGENMHFFFFPAHEEGGQAIAEATRAGGFSVRLGEEFHRWRLPLGSLLRPKVCPVDRVTMNGAWDYCPWHGNKLILQVEKEKEVLHEGNDD